MQWTVTVRSLAVSVNSFLRYVNFVRDSNFQDKGSATADAEGIIQIIMLLPGRAAATARKSAANVIVRYLGGDMSLVDEVLANKQIQAELDPEHPARIFGESVPKQPSLYEMEMTRNARMQSLSAAFQLAQAINSTSLPRLQAEAQKAIDEVLLPPGDKTEDYVDATEILLERAYTREQVERLSGEFGKDLKLVFMSERQNAHSNEQEFMSHHKQIGRYHRIRDAGLIEDVLASFKERPLYTRVMDGQAAPIPSKSRSRLLNAQGRGRTRSQRRLNF